MIASEAQQQQPATGNPFGRDDVLSRVDHVPDKLERLDPATAKSFTASNIPAYSS